MSETTFKDAYGVLQSHAEKLRNQREPNIDDLLTIVTESVNAYKVCKARIDAVEKALEHALNNAEDDGGVNGIGAKGQQTRQPTRQAAGAAPSEATSPDVRPEPPPPADDFDIPF